MSCLPVCDETTGFIVPITPEEICGFKALRLRKSKCKKSVCLPIIQGPPGPEGLPGLLFVNNTSFIDSGRGNNAIAEPEVLNRPYTDLQTAIDQIPEEATFWQLYLWPGNYDIGNLILPDLDLAIQGSGINTTTVLGSVVNFGSNNVSLANLTLNTPPGSTNTFLLSGTGSIRARDLRINRNAGVGELGIASTSDGATGEIEIVDSQILYTSLVNARLIDNEGGRITLKHNEVNYVGGTVGTVVLGRNNSVTEISDNTFSYSIDNTNNLTLYAISADEGSTTRVIVNDNYHTIIASNYTANLVIYTGSGTSAAGSITSLLGRNNEYFLQGSFADDSVISIFNDNQDVLIKVVDDTWPNREPIPPAILPGEVDPDNDIQYQMNSGNSLATNQGIQFATREISGDHTVTDDDYFIRASGTVAITVTLPPPDERIRGKKVVIRNDSTMDLTVTSTAIVGMTIILTGEVKQYINTGAGGSWYDISVA